MIDLYGIEDDFFLIVRRLICMTRFLISVITTLILEKIIHSCRSNMINIFISPIEPNFLRKMPHYQVNKTDDVRSRSIQMMQESILDSSQVRTSLRFQLGRKTERKTTTNERIMV